MMEGLPFTVSPAVETHLGAWLRYVAEIVPEVADLVPVLCRGGSRTIWTWEGGSARPDYSDEDYSIGYFRPDHVTGWPRLRLGGADLAVSPETLAKLRPLHLVLTGATEGDVLSGQVVGRRY